MRTRMILATSILTLSGCVPPQAEEPEPAATTGDQGPGSSAEAAPAASTENLAGLPTVGALAVHDVEDYVAWKEGFDARAHAREAAGLMLHAVSRGFEDPNGVSVYLGSDDIEKVKAFLADPGLKEAMTGAGVKGEPRFFLMTHTDLKPHQGEGVEVEVFVSHEVEDYDRWKAAFDAHDSKRVEASQLGCAVSRDIDNPNLVYVWIQASDIDKIQAFIASADLKQVMKEAGVKGKPNITLRTPVETLFYE